VRRDHWQRQIARLDPETEFEEISRILALYEFPWDIQQALSFALFRTYAVPAVGVLLYDTQQFIHDTQKRHDDTALILEAVGVNGMESRDGRAAIRRMNQMHGSYDISNDDMRYVLSTFVVTPQRWIERYGWRRLTADERLASVRYYQRLGRLMGIKDIPETYEEFSDHMDAYEAAHFRPDPRTREVADATLGLLTTFYPRPLRRAVKVFSIALLDDHLREAFGYRHPPRVVVALSHAALRLRGRLVRLLPPRRKPQFANDLKRIKSYPGGYLVEKLGTFPESMPSVEPGETLA
jgi:uncharacterized protein (DUF2236 family)